MWPFSTSYPQRSPQQLEQEYDYIIVGGGTAGCVLARRLAEDRSCTVLLVERGDARDNWLDRFPVGSTHHWSDRKHSMVLEADMLGRKAQIITGKGLGGSSRINAMQYSRGAPGEYNAWARSGRKGWSYDELVPYFERAECLYNPVTHSHYGTKGLWQIQAPADTFKFGVGKHVIDAASKAGFAQGKDVNDPRVPTSGCFLIHHTIDQSGQRSSTFRAFLPKELALAHQDILHICVNTIARKVEVADSEEDGLRATGVQLQAHGPGSPTVYVRAKREVIVCCGALRTPQVLMLSGIGPEKHLQDMGITVVHRLDGVGANLQDHMGTLIDFQCPLGDSMVGILFRPWLILYHLFRYLIFGDGVFLTSMVEVCIMTTAAFLDMNSSQKPLSDEEKDSTRPENVPEIEIMTSALADWRFPGYDKSRGAFSLLTAPLRPSSRGTLRLRTSDPWEQPTVDLQYLAHPRDRDILRTGMRLCLRLADEMHRAGYAVSKFRAPASGSDADLDAFATTNSSSFVHYSSTCRMAPMDDADGPGVVDDELRVHGIPNLRLCDASIFPQIPAAHLQAPCVVVAERCADMVKAAMHAKAT